MSILRATYSLVALLLALSVVACRHGPSETTHTEPTPEKQPTAETTPSRAGTILVRRDDDLYQLKGQSERRITQSGDYVTGMLTRDGHVVALRQADQKSSSLVLIEVEGSSVSTTAEILLNQPIPERMRRSGYLVPSPDGEHVLVPGPEGYLLVSLEAKRVEREMPPGCCRSWSPDGSRVAYMVLADDQQIMDELPKKYDLWVTDSESGTSPRHVASDLMHWFDFFGRYADSFAWWKNSASILALSSDDVIWIERKYQLRGRVNNRLVSVDLTTDEKSELLISSNLHQRISQEVSALEDEMVISAPATTKGGDRAAFLAMDYMNVFSVGMLDSDGQLERLVTVEMPEKELVSMGAPVWSPDDTRLAYFGWRWRPTVKAFIEVLDPSTDAITRVWESQKYPKPGHWDWSPDGEWIWIVVAERSQEEYGGYRVPRDISMLASVTRPGHVESVPGIILDWCCAP